MRVEHRISVLPSGHPVIALVGELDLSTTQALEDILADASQLSVHLIVDLSSVCFMDSTALSVLLQAHRQAVPHGGSVVLVGVADPVRRIMAFTHIEDELTVHPSPDEAVLAWQRRPERGDRRRDRGTHRRLPQLVLRQPVS